jgi:hypothetical protein
MDQNSDSDSEGPPSLVSSSSSDGGPQQPTDAAVPPASDSLEAEEDEDKLVQPANATETMISSRDSVGMFIIFFPRGQEPVLAENSTIVARGSIYVVFNRPLE